MKKNETDFLKITQLKIIQVNFTWPPTVDNPLDAVDVSVGVEENTVRDLSISSSSPRLLVVTLH